MAPTAVQLWFGHRFGELHPLLQDIHRHGGLLRGAVDVGVGPGLAGWIGRRLAQRLGVPLEPLPTALEVEIAHGNSALFWRRRFTGNGAPPRELLSVFVPQGTIGAGWWAERTGAMEFRLTVDIADGAWHWRALGARLHGVPLPLRLLPHSRAFKRVEAGRYRFEVVFEAPLLGALLWYRGHLDALRLGAASPSGSPRP